MGLCQDPEAAPFVLLKVQILKILASARAKRLSFLCVFLCDLCVSVVNVFGLLVAA